MTGLLTMLMSILLLAATSASAEGSCSVEEYIGTHAIFSSEMTHVSEDSALAQGWKHTYVHPGDSNVVVRFGSVETIPARKQDEDLFKKNSHRAQRGIERMFAKSGYQVLDQDLPKSPYAWSVTAVSPDSSIIAEYYSRRVSDACEFTASWSLPVKYHGSAIHTRIASAVQGISSLATSMSEPITLKSPQYRPSGYLPIFLATFSVMVSSFIFFAVMRGLGVYSRAFLGLYAKLALGTGLAGISLWMAYDIFNVVRMRADIENMEVIFIGVGIAIYAVIWIGAIHIYHAASFLAAWISISLFLGIYMFMGWHWDTALAIKWMSALVGLLVLALPLFGRAATLSNYLDQAEKELQTR
jgi:hypothetical protein